MRGARVVVVGGGLAGISAAVEAAGRGARVTLLERRPFLGGKAFSFTDPRTGEEIDNGASSLQPQGDFPRRPAHHLPTCPLPEMPTGRLGRYLGSTVPAMGPGPVSPCHRSRNARL